MMPDIDFDVTDQDIEVVTNHLKVLSNPDRLKILRHLIDGEVNVQTIEKLTEIHQPTLSQQLTVLRKSEMVSTRRDGKQIFYQIADPKVLVLMQTFYDLYCEEPA
ncbi:MAG: metalloregulator ArsR/SmtB family transcription factor [Pseudomonadota bacterium]|nr:metalloregulator ArsR/SmtB family transcription factor [Pseudomonadota bacterium]